MTTIASIYNLATPKVYTNSRTAPIPNPDPSLLYGVELEIENANVDMCVSGMRVEEDGSLRNDGLEFITQPMTLSNLNYCLSAFFDKNELNSDNYSERCSVHVHTNCLDLTVEQVASICLLYQVFEDLLFKFVGGERSHNIFCVPWAETQLSYRSVDKLIAGDTAPFYDWQKYTALNLLPLTSQGTVEWRHMPGTNSIGTIITFCRLIGCMYAYARANSLQQTKEFLISLNNTSAYNNVLDTVFGAYANVLRIPGYETILEDGVLNMKFSLVKRSNKFDNIIKPRRIETAWPATRVWTDEQLEHMVEELRTMPRMPAPMEQL